MSYYNSAYDSYNEEQQGEYQPARAGWKQTSPAGQEAYQPPPRSASLNTSTTQNSNGNMNGYGGGINRAPIWGRPSIREEGTTSTCLRRM
ncbi:hypothetical protein H4I95_09212 [Botrytis cinerea]